MSSNVLPPIEQWPNRPIVVRRGEGSLMSDSTAEQLTELRQPVNIHAQQSLADGSLEYDPRGSLIPIDSDLFQGYMRINVKGISGLTPNYFDNKKREFEIIVQGKFKHSVHGDKVFTGQVFEETRIKIQHPWLIQSILYLIRTFLKDIQVEADARPQYIISPALTTMQIINVSKSGSQPSILENANLIIEDMSLQGRSLKGSTFSSRKAFFSDESNLRDFVFRKELVYTFVTYQHIVALSTFEFLLGISNVDIQAMIGKAPLQLMAVYFDKVAYDLNPSSKWKYFWNLEVWHEKCLQEEETTAASKLVVSNSNATAS